MRTLSDLDAVVSEYDGRSRTVLEFTQTMKRVIDDAKQPGFSSDGWAPLAAFIAIDDFERIGPFKDAMNWSSYVDFLTAWATTSHWECSFKRVTETDDLVFLELEERMEPGDSTNAVNSVSVYEFDDEGQIRHLDVYLQMVLPG